ncbi:ABC transporter ATP-binding protein [Frankia sp. Cppng1_Ct_nod]|uniref:ATP-binding cassette domain-containing protein n=1 Tax=Frankia sp. Cppng1_Ct_nod TaxID=2897162 RepID=UPI001F5F373B|nr:ABC transporter ATP-binding protein [Frankia sp. Cppng1_Ct_nod]
MANNVSAESAAKFALHGVSIDVKAGTTVAVVGPSGAGKTSLAHLASGLATVERGSVLIGGKNIQEISERERSSLVALVGQDAFLFHDTVATNVRYGCSGVADEEIAAACRLAGLADVVAGLPQKYETVLGERGLRLSGGERQRLVLARALVRQPRVLVLDEPTSHLDSTTAEELRLSLKEIRRGRTKGNLSSWTPAGP